MIVDWLDLCVLKILCNFGDFLCDSFPVYLINCLCDFSFTYYEL
jgi:hypothetical protein